MKRSSNFALFFLIFAYRCIAGDSGIINWGPITNDMRMRIMVSDNSWLFLPRDIIDLTTLAARLRSQSDPASIFVLHRLTESDQLLVENYLQSSNNEAQVRSIIIQEFNKIIAGPSIYDEQRFKEVTLESETKGLLASTQTGSTLARLNHLLLEDAFPSELSKDLRGGSEIIKSNSTLSLMIMFTNASVSNFVRVPSLPEMLSEFNSKFVVVSPSGKEMPTKSLPNTSRSGASSNIGPLKTKQYILELSQICKFNEVGIYTITARGYVNAPGRSQPVFEVVSNPLEITVVPP
jgi:hypothetical protein